ncbi:MAG TPA: copper chaperone PCu(A)C, partial [Gemmatimonadales bacterium]|nr:copper chaperone PCu(A)C [Gemmatimonadales bacterium]
RALLGGLRIFKQPTMPVSAQSATVTVRDAWVREAGAGRPTTAAFMILENKGAVLRALLRGSASVGDTLELHEMKRDDGMMRMSPVQRIEIPAHGEVALRPGGLHLMIFGLKAPLTATDSVALTLTFDDGSVLTLKAPVRPMQGMRP